MSEWVDIKQRLPERGSDVKVKNKGNEDIATFFTCKNNHPYFYFSSSTKKRFKPTHWQSLSEETK